MREDWIERNEEAQAIYFLEEEGLVEVWDAYAGEHQLDNESCKEIVNWCYQFHESKFTAFMEHQYEVAQEPDADAQRDDLLERERDK